MLAETVQSLQQEKCTLEDKTQRLEASNASAVSELNQEISALKLAWKESKDLSTQQRSSLEKKDVEIAELRGQVEECAVQLRESGKVCEEATNKGRDLVQKMESLASDNQDLKAQLDQARAQLSEQIEAVSQEKQALLAQWEEALIELERIDASNQQTPAVAVGDGKHAHLQGEAQSHEVRADIRTQENRTECQGVPEGASLAKVADDDKQAHAEAKDVNEVLDGIMDRHKQLQAACNVVRNERDDAIARLQELESRMEQVKTERDAAVTGLQRVDTDMENARNEVCAMSASMLEKQDEIVRLVGALETTSADLRQTAAALQTAQEDKEQTLVSLSQAKGDIVRLQDRLDQLSHVKADGDALGGGPAKSESVTQVGHRHLHIYITCMAL